MSKALLKLPVGGPQDEKEIVDIRPGIVLPLVPVARTLLQGFIIALFVLFHEALDADVATYLITEMVTLKK